MKRSVIRKRLNSRVSCMTRRFKLIEKRLTGQMERTAVCRRLEGRCRGAIRGRIGRALSPWKHLPYTTEELARHLEDQFTDGMTWENMAYWHIDHIRPISSFCFESFDDPEFLECFALSNLQPLWGWDNSRKGGRWFHPNQLTLFEI